MDREAEAFVRFCRFERRLAELTCSAYERDIRACLKYLRGEGFASWSEVRPPDLARVPGRRSHAPAAASSQARTVAALKGFFRFCVESEWLERDPALALRTPKKREALPDVLDRHELKQLMRAPDLAVWERAHHDKRERDRLLLALFAYAGLGRKAGSPSRRASLRSTASRAYSSELLSDLRRAALCNFILPAILRTSRRRSRSPRPAPPRRWRSPSAPTTLTSIARRWRPRRRGC